MSRRGNGRSWRWLLVALLAPWIAPYDFDERTRRPS